MCKCIFENKVILGHPKGYIRPSVKKTPKKPTSSCPCELLKFRLSTGRGKFLLLEYRVYEHHGRELMLISNMFGFFLYETPSQRNLENSYLT